MSNWDNDSALLEEIIEILSDELEDDQKERVYAKLIKLFDQENSIDLLEVQTCDPIFDDQVADYYDNGDNEDDESEEL